MADAKIERRLAAILAADVADYSRHMGADEDSTMDQWWMHRRNVIDPQVVEFRGRIVKHTGDGFLAEFASAMDAVNCALAMQAGIAEGAAQVAADKRIGFRMGVNLGDIMSDDEDIYGDGVNIAARIEALADPGSVYISGSVYEQIRSKPAFACTAKGEHELKNIAEPVRVFQVLPAGGDSVEAAEVPEEPAPATPDEDNPSLAVLPFDNMSGDPEQEYFADGMTEDLITDLSKISGLLVIARNSVFTYKGQSVNVPDVCRELGVRWALEGSVRKAGNRIRVNAQLIDGGTGGHLWAERFDRDLDDIFAVQDEVTAEIVDALKLKVSREDIAAAVARPTTDMGVYDAFLRAREKMWHSSPQSIKESAAMLEALIDENPDFAPALGCHAITQLSLFTNQWSDDKSLAWDNAVSSADRAYAVDPGDINALLALGILRMFQRRPDDAREFGWKLINKEPNNPAGLSLLANIDHHVGSFAQAVEGAEAAIRVDPYGPDIILQVLGQAAFMMGDFDKAERVLKQRIERNPATDTSHLYLASMYGHQGRNTEAQAEWAEIFRVNPGYSLAERIATWPYMDDIVPKYIVAGLEKAGIDHQIPS